MPVAKSQSLYFTLCGERTWKMKNLQRHTPVDIWSAPYGFTYKEMVEVIGREKRKIYTRHYISIHQKKNT